MYGIQVQVQSPLVNKTTSTDAEGIFKFSNLPSDFYQLGITRVDETAWKQFDIEVNAYHEKNGKIYLR